MKKKLKSKALIINSYHLTIGMFWLMLLGLARILNIKSVFNVLAEKIEYRIDKMY